VSRILDTFLELVRIDSPSGEEAACARQVAAALAAAGLAVGFDDTAAVTGSDTGNLIATLPGTAPGKRIVLSAHLDTVDPGGSVFVRPGNYDETASSRWVTASSGGPNGPHQFGLFVPRSQSGITIQGVTAGDVPITTAAGVQAHVTTNATNNFGWSGVFIEGDDVTIRGMAIGKNAAGENKTIEVIGDDFALDASDIEAPYGAVYIDDWDYNTGTDAYLRHLEACVAELEIPVIGSLNGISVGGWLAHAKRLQDAGAERSS
jgi:hypothetical protein